VKAFEIIADITDHKQVEDELRKSEVKTRSIFRAAPIGIGLVSGNCYHWRLFRWNACESVFVVSRDGDANTVTFS
jgi:PAS domain-containing protein